MKIQQCQSYRLEVPLDPPIADSQSYIPAWGVVAVRLETDNGEVGWGYNCNTGHGGEMLQTFFERDIFPALIGQDPSEVRGIWERVYVTTHAVGISGSALLGASAPEIAVWDLFAKSLQLPLHKLLGTQAVDRVPCYNTDGGWLSLSTGELIEKMKRLLDEGYQGVKMKVGGPDPAEDLRRVEAVRKALGDAPLMIDANTNWDLPTAVTTCRRLEPLNLEWIEEPLHPFDVKGHAELARALTMPVMVGETIYTLYTWRDYLEAGAADLVQLDVMKLGGISNWQNAAALARAYGRRVVTASFDMMQVSVHLAATIPHLRICEVIPWLQPIFERPVKYADGHLLVPQEPGVGCDIKEAALEKYGVR